MPTYQKNAETVDFVHTTAGAGVYEEKLDYFVFSIAIKNDTSSDVTLYLNQYTDDALVIDASSYQEVAVTTNYFRAEYAGTGETIIVSVVKSASVEELLTPLFPNLFEQADVDGDGNDENIKVDPINAYGYTFTPWVSSAGGAYLGDGSTLVEIEYYFDGRVVSLSNSTDFYGDLYNLVMQEIQSFYPENYTPPTNPEYSSVQTAEIVENVKNYLNQFELPFNDEYFAGYASLTAYDADLKTTTFTLESGSAVESIATPWTVLGGTFDPGAANATIRYKRNPSDAWTVVNLSANTPEVFTESAKYFEVTSGTVDITFNGNYVRMIDFAPIINIVYPLGFTETEGIPSESFATFEATLTEFRENLENNHFTGRVVYFRFQPFIAQASPVYDADTVIPRDSLEPVRYVFEEMRPYVYNYYQYSKLEEDLLLAIVRENYNYYHPGGVVDETLYPTTLEEVIEDNNVTIRGISSEAEKKSFVLELLHKEYTSPYGLGGFSVHTPGSTYNRKDIN